jgi:hypothetical protein
MWQKNWCSKNFFSFNKSVSILLLTKTMSKESNEISPQETQKEATLEKEEKIEQARKETGEKEEVENSSLLSQDDSFTSHFVVREPPLGWSSLRGTSKRSDAINEEEDESLTENDTIDENSTFVDDVEAKFSDAQTTPLRNRSEKLLSRTSEHIIGEESFTLENSTSPIARGRFNRMRKTVLEKTHNHPPRYNSFAKRRVWEGTYEYYFLHFKPIFSDSLSLQSTGNYSAGFESLQTRAGESCHERSRQESKRNGHKKRSLHFFFEYCQTNYLLHVRRYYFGEV